MKKVAGEVYAVDVGEGYELLFSKTILKSMHDSIIEAHHKLDKVSMGGVLILFTEDFDFILYKMDGEVFVNIIYRNQKGLSHIAVSIKLSLTKAVDIFYADYRNTFQER